MSEAKQNDGWDARQIHRLRHRVAMVRHVIDLEGRWSTTDVTDVDDRKRLDGAVRVLRQSGAVRKVDKLYPTDRDDVGSWINVYRWTPDAKAYLREYLEDLDELPCGHRKHIHNPRDSPEGMLACKECGREYERETVEALL